MLTLKGITKTYEMGESSVEALRGIDISFRESEFVSVLGPSGCGKTTLLNIIGGLDVYTKGDLVINGVSTKHFRDRDWDTYRNHSIGFVFQSYNLIPHQNVLSNVELALTVSGVSKSERRRRATEALEKVGLGDQLKKKPNQMSGGQIQRVAIARALVNDPDILLADEPTGALDTETSVTVMELLKEISKTKLVIMVTHNPDLAEKYATRTVKLIDGEIISDTSPFIPAEADIKRAEEKHIADKKKGKRSMSFATATSLSFNNLRTKKGRTAMTSFAGSIGIIGIALILAVSNGFQNYINTVQADTLSSYPLTITQETVDVSSLLGSIMGKSSDANLHGLDKVYSREVISTLVNSMVNEVKTNELSGFKKFLDSGTSGIDEYVSAIKYGYGVEPLIYASDTSEKITQVNPGTVMNKIYGDTAGDMYSSYSGMYSMYGASTYEVWSEMLDNRELIASQYDVIAGRMPEENNPFEVVLAVDKNNEVSDLVLYSLGLRDQDELAGVMSKVLEHKEFNTESTSYTYDEILNTTFRLVLGTDYYEYDSESGTWINRSKSESYLKKIIAEGDEIKVVGIIRPTQNAAATSISGSVGYSSALTRYIINEVNNSEIAKAQLADSTTDVFTGLKFPTGEKKQVTMDEVQAYIATLPEEQQAQMQGYMASMSEEQIIAMFSERLAENTSESSYEKNIEALGIKDIENPETISIYPIDFEAKDNIKTIISDYNSRMESEGTPEKSINYSDYIGILLSSVTKIIDTITYVLIAFVAISLVVSSIMIGIITYISVLERTKEIGILRSIGASKKDISRVFNAETFIVGLVSGGMGIGLTLLILLPVNLILDSLTGIAGMAALPALGAVILIAISVILTVIAGLIPAKLASKRDPVVALRSE